MKSLLEKTRKISTLLQNQEKSEAGGEITFNNLAQVLGDTLDSNTYVIDSEGALVGYNEKLDINNDRVKQMIADKRFPKAYAEGVSKVSETIANVGVTSEITAFPVEFREMFSDGLTTVVPIFGGGERLGTIILGRIDFPFVESDLILAEYSATVVGMEMLNQHSRKKEMEIRRTAGVTMALKTLSYSELKAVKAIFEALDGDEGRLTTSSIADQIGITRSVIVNALRKLESASIIESRSLGMKGTYIRVINPNFLEELNKENII